MDFFVFDLRYTLYQCLVVLQGRSIAKNLNKILLQIIKKGVLECKLGVTYFLTLATIFICKNFDKQSFLIGLSKIVKKYQKPQKWWFLAVFEYF